MLLKLFYFGLFNYLFWYFTSKRIPQHNNKFILKSDNFFSMTRCVIWPIVLIYWTQFQLWSVVEFLRSCRKVMFSVVSICLHEKGGGQNPHVTVTRDVLDLTIQGLPFVQDPAGPQPWPPFRLHMDMFILVELGPHCAGTPTPDILNVLIMRLVWLASGRLASYWNAFLFFFSCHYDCSTSGEWCRSHIRAVEIIQTPIKSEALSFLCIL